MLADQLVVDADQGRAAVLWRGSFPVQSEAAATAMTIVAGVALPNQPVAWPTRDQLMASPILQAYGLVASPHDEDEDQRDCLIELGCDELQGFLFSSAVPASQVPAAVAAIERNTKPAAERRRRDRSLF